MPDENREKTQCCVHRTPCVSPRADFPTRGGWTRVARGVSAARDDNVDDVDDDDGDSDDDSEDDRGSKRHF